MGYGLYFLGLADFWLDAPASNDQAVAEKKEWVRHPGVDRSGRCTGKAAVPKAKATVHKGSPFVQRQLGKFRPHVNVALANDNSEACKGETLSRSDR